MTTRRRAKTNKTLPSLEGSTVPGRITINLSGDMAVAINTLAARRAASKNSVAESLIRTAFLNDSSRSTNAAQRKADVLRYSRILVEALQEAVDYDPGQRHNRPVPELRVSDDDRFLQELKNIITELKLLNRLLENKRRRVSATQKEIISLGQHFDKFLTSYTSAFGKAAGKGSWYLLVGGIGGLLYHAGVGKDLIDSIWAHLRLPK